MIGLMGVGDDGKTLFAPDGKRLCRVPRWAAVCIQRIQHKLASLPICR